MKVIVACNHHELLPFAWRLRKEGAEVETVVWKDRYERAWEGLLPKREKKAKWPKDRIQDLITEGEEGKALVVTDGSPRSREAFGNAQDLYASADETGDLDYPKTIGFGGWYDGTHLHAIHGLIGDWGVFAGGLGKATLGGLTLVRLEDPSSVPVPPMELLDRKGLVAWWVKYNMAQEAEVQRVDNGWSFLHTHAFVSDLQSLGDILQGGVPVLEKRFVVTAPLSQPPWPLECNLTGAEDQVVGGWEHEDLNNIFLHDFYTEEGSILTAGLDGLVAVVRGSSDLSVNTARGQALELLTKCQLPEKQFRLDVGAQSETSLQILERLGIH